MDELRLGDIIDDYCIKCRRMTNHAIVSIVEEQAAKVRCRSCYHDHTYLHEQIPPSKKDLKKLELVNAALAGGATDHKDEDEPADLVSESDSPEGENSDLEGAQDSARTPASTPANTPARTKEA